MIARDVGKPVLYESTTPVSTRGEVSVDAAWFRNVECGTENGERDRVSECRVSTENGEHGRLSGCCESARGVGAIENGEFARVSVSCVPSGEVDDA